MRNDQLSIFMRRTLCAASLYCLVGCSGPSMFSKTKGPTREEELVKTLNEERKRAQYYENQYEQAIAQLDPTAPNRAKSNSLEAGRRKSPYSSVAFSEPRGESPMDSKSSQQFVSSESKTPKVLNRLVNTIPGLRLGPDKTWAKLDTDLLFGGGSQEVSSSASEMLSDLAKTLTQENASDVRVLVVGYSDTQRSAEAEADAKGEDATWQIAAQRAVEVVRKLGQNGVTADRLSAMSRGAQDPVAGNDSAAARAQNRRVEIYLLERDSTWAPDWTAALR